MLARLRNWTTPGTALLALVLLGAAVAALLDIVPVASQELTLHAQRTPGDVPLGDPWAGVWKSAAKQEVALSKQNITFPFGGGTVNNVSARALHDDQTLFVLLEWADPAPNDSLRAVDEFTDAAALEFPGGTTTELPPYTMGGKGAAVNIWQWKAAWQTDIGKGFRSTESRFPNTVVDNYPGAGNPLYRTAEYVGNLLARRQHDTPIENLVAEGFGSLTTAEVQDVSGAGVWRNGKWRVLFARPLVPASAELARFVVGDRTSVAFAVWDGGKQERSGQKSIAPFINLQLDSEVAGGRAVSSAWALIIVLAVVAAAAVLVAVMYRRYGRAA